MLKRIMLMILGLVLASTAIAGVHSNEGDVFIDVSWGRFDLDGEFDDSLILSTSTQVINVPEVLEADGYNFAIGRAFDTGGVSFFYFTAQPQTVSVLGDEDSRFHLYGMDGYALPFSNDRKTQLINPLIRGSMSMVSLGIDNSATNGSTLADATFKGIAAALGIGVLVQLGSTGHITAEIDRRWMSFSTVTGTGDSIDLAESISLTSDFIKVGVSIYMH